MTRSRVVCTSSRRLWRWPFSSYQHPWQTWNEHTEQSQRDTSDAPSDTFHLEVADPLEKYIIVVGGRRRGSHGRELLINAKGLHGGAVLNDGCNFMRRYAEA